MQRKLTSCSLTSFLIVSLTSFINKPDSLRDLIIFIISSISLFEIINIVIPDPKTFFCTAASVADNIAVNLNGVKTILANGLGTFIIKGKPVFSNGFKCLPNNPPHCLILCN